MQAASLPPQVSLKNGAYSVMSTVGRGGFGVVYRAVSPDGKVWAIKECLDGDRVTRGSDGLSVIPRADKPLAAKEHTHQRKRAHEEAEVFSMASLDHRNLVSVADCFDENGTTYLVMPFINGRSLHEISEGKKNRTDVWIVNVLNQIVDALEVLHAKGIIHRDLKPDNILVVEDLVEKSACPVIVDTGAARDFLRREMMHTGIITDFGPPEIVDRSYSRLFGHPSAGSDCFSLAGIAWLLLTGEKPQGWSARLASEKGSGFDSLVIPRGLPTKVGRVLCKSLSLHVANRHATPREFLRDLSESLGFDNVNYEKVSEFAGEVGDGVKCLNSTAIAFWDKLGPDWVGWFGAVFAQLFGVLLFFLVFDYWLAVFTSIGWVLLNWVGAIWLVEQGLRLNWACFPGFNIWLWLVVLRSKKENIVK